MCCEIDFGLDLDFGYVMKMVIGLDLDFGYDMELGFDGFGFGFGFGLSFGFWFWIWIEGSFKISMSL